MRTTYYTDKKGSEAIIKGLTAILGTKEDNSKIKNDYSLGFIRYSKLNKAKKLESFKSLFLEGFKDVAENDKELKLRLNAMTDEEFKSFKK